MASLVMNPLKRWSWYLVRQFILKGDKTSRERCNGVQTGLRKNIALGTPSPEQSFSATIRTIHQTY